MKEIILASKSQRRKKLLKQIGLMFDTIPSNISLVKSLALKKAKNVSKKVRH
jgi:predicted house-cleaning NTP pyrophosphatase (Maf/HAM1 superfamily)